MAKKRKHDTDEEDTEDKLFEVEAILGARLDVDLEWEYYVKWLGFEDEHNSWEPTAGLENCVDAQGRFWNHIGQDNKDYNVGEEVMARKDWVDEEIRAYRKAHHKPKKAKESTRRSASTGSPALSSASKVKNKSKKKITVSDDKDMSKMHEARKPKQKRKAISSGESSDEVPLSKPKRKPKRKSQTPTNDIASAFNSIAERNPVHEASEFDEAKVKLVNALFGDQSDEDDKYESLFGSDPSPEEHEPSASTSGSGLTKTFSNVTSPTFGGPFSSSIPKVSKKKEKRESTVVLPPPPRRSRLPPTPVEPAAPTLGSSLPTKQRLGKLAMESALPRTIAANASNKTGVSRDPITPITPSGSGSMFGPPISRRPDSLKQESARETSTSASNKAVLVQGHIDTTVPKVDIHTLSNPEPGYFDPPAELGEPFEAEVQGFLDAIASPVASSPGVKRSMPMTRIPKKWSWTGELKLISPADSRSLGQARISDGTFRPDTGIPWGTALDGQSELTLSLHHIVDMPTILDTCLPLRQFARINDEATDEVRPTSLDKLASTLLLGDLVAFAQFDIGDVKALLMFFHPDMDVQGNFPHLSDINAELGKNSTLLVALLPFNLEESDGAENRTPAPLDHEHAVRLLNPDKWLQAWLGSGNRPYFIWTGGTEPEQDPLATQNFEVEALLCVLREYKNTHQVDDPKQDVKAFFVHVSALHTMGDIPLLMERRSRLDVMFMLFGSHEDVPPMNWGTREIYPVGGIATFTAAALLNDPLGVDDRISKLADHPLWATYIIPSVFGLVAKQYYVGKSREEILEVFDRGEFAYDFILTAIDQGKVSIMKAPPPDLIDTVVPWEGRTFEHKHHQAWKDYVDPLFTHGQRGALEACLRVFESQYANANSTDYFQATNREVAEDMANMQLQPCVIKDYRRFVIMTGDANESRVDAFEWVNVLSFRFDDNFVTLDSLPVRGLQ